MNQDSVVVRCERCGTKNRIPQSRVNENPVCGKCKSPLRLRTAPSRPVEVTDQNFQQEVLAHQGAVLLDCWAPWCGPCRMVAPILEELASKYAGRAKIAKLNVDENPAAASRFQVQSIPTLLFFKNGRQVDRAVGALPRQELEKGIQRLL